MAELRIIEVGGGEDLEHMRELFVEYSRDLPFDLSFQDFEEELKGLPGRYAPPSGRMLLAERGGAFVGCVALRQIGEDVCEGEGPSRENPSLCIGEP